MIHGTDCALRNSIHLELGGVYSHRILVCRAVIILMVLQFDNTMVLQRVELEEKVSSSHFWVFGS